MAKKSGKGCRSLNARLSLLIERGGAAKRSLQKVLVDHPEPMHDPAFARDFDEAAHSLADALGDVTSRLELLDNLLAEMAESPAVHAEL